jgi:hypothetical protein
MARSKYYSTKRIHQILNTYLYIGYGTREDIIKEIMKRFEYKE